jgi:hypothetical protein
VPQPQHYRHFYGPQKTAPFNFQWDIINRRSFVVITASEGSPDGSGNPNRIIGNAHFQVSSVAPHDGGVTFWVIIGDAKVLHDGFFNWWIDPLPTWVDITVFDPSDPSGQN